MSDPQIRMYCSGFCPYCTRANQLLESKGVEFEQIEVNSAEIRQEMEQASKQTSVPQIFVGDLHLGGCDDIYALERAGKL
ncbi:MAG: glutaredoxin 3, partial [Gammaproteobacteria bacterium]|nr:glutaredoxin 3 [Gammaproteobacteria bacterium]